MQNDKTGILLSGGMDSIALTYWKRPELAFTVDYGQRGAEAEIRASKEVATQLKIEHHIIRINCSSLGSGDLVNLLAINVAPSSEWWPFRNQMLVTFACMKGVSLGLKTLMVGTVSTDNFHADGSSEFFCNLAKVTQCQEGNISIEAPAIDMSTEELIRVSNVPFPILFWSHSCHTSNTPCMTCNGCLKYLRVIQNLGLD